VARRGIKLTGGSRPSVGEKRGMVRGGGGDGPELVGRAWAEGRGKRGKRPGVRVDRERS